MVFAARLFVPAGDERRYEARDAVQARSTLRSGETGPFDVEVRDISAHGFRASFSGDLKAGDNVQIGLAGEGRADARVMWVAGGEIGCAFASPLPPAVVEAAFRGTPIVWLSPGTGDAEGDAPGAAAQAVDIARDQWPVGRKVALIVGSSAALWGMVIAPWLIYLGTGPAVG